MWTIQFNLMNVAGKINNIYKIYINFDGLISCNCKDFIFRCKKECLPCKHLLHVAQSILNKNDDEIKIFFKTQQKLTYFDIENIKTKIKDNNFCLICCEQINNKNHMDKNMFNTIKLKFDCNCICHNHCLNKLYEYANQ
jgi:hypothetical protein